MAGYLINRELSWLSFNMRVLGLAAHGDVPLLERLRFVSIFSSNLDEFFMVRAGSLEYRASLGDRWRDNKTHMTAREQLIPIYERVRRMYAERDAVCAALFPVLDEKIPRRVMIRDLSEPERKFLKAYFKSSVLPLLSPQVIDSRYPFPHLENGRKYVFLRFRAEEKRVFGLIPVGQAHARLILLPGKERYVIIEDLIAHYAREVFGIYRIAAKAFVRVTRSADLDLDEALLADENIDYRGRVKKLLKKRARLSPVRLEIEAVKRRDARIEDFLQKKLGLCAEQVFYPGAPSDAAFFDALLALSAELLPEESRDGMFYPPFAPALPPELDGQPNVMNTICKKDILINYPYDGMQALLRLLREAADDPCTLSIRITLYRTGPSSRVAELLSRAAENGKDVTAVLELRARFDEANNLGWSARLEESGVRVMYGPDGYKIHAKLLLICRRVSGEIRYLTHVATGNFNEATARLYTDCGLFTSSEELGRDAALFFSNIATHNLSGEYERFLVSPHTLKSGLIELINGEIEKARSGGRGRIVAKMNSLTCLELIERLAEASRSGVEVSLIVRGICCLLPGVPGETENIEIVSVLGRFLEHSRVFIFGEGAERRVFLSSADMMTRNMDRRVELCCPVDDKALADRLSSSLDKMLAANARAFELGPDGGYSERGGRDCQRAEIEERL